VAVGIHEYPLRRGRVDRAVRDQHGDDRRHSVRIVRASLA
jgi:hypothetical protein